MYCTIPMCIIYCRIHQKRNTHSRPTTWMFWRWLDLLWPCLKVKQFLRGILYPYLFQAKVYTYFHWICNERQQYDVGINCCFLDSFLQRDVVMRILTIGLSWSALFLWRLRIVIIFLLIIYSADPHVKIFYIARIWRKKTLTVKKG